MQPLAQLSRRLADDVSSRELLEILSEKYSLAEQEPRTAEITYLDTFDWRLYAAKRLCRLEDKTLFLTDFTDRLLAAPLPLTGKTIPRFHQQLPESELRTELAGIIDIRALLPQVTFSRTSMEVQVLNRDEKVVAHLLFLSIDPGNGEVIHSLQLREVRGYNKWFLKLSRDLGRFGSPQPDTGVHGLETALAALGRAPMEYSSGFFVPLQPDMAAIEAAKAIYRNLLATMRSNERGIIEDLDSEFLHDFRVAVRRTRSGLALLKNVLDPEICERFKDEFRFLGRITGPVRDLDVYLLMEDNYKARLPGHLQEGLHYFFEDLAKRRRLEQKKLVRNLAAPRYQSIIEDWQDYLDQPDSGENSNSLVPVAKLADTIITKRFKRVLRDGRAIHADSPDEDLHRLRIQGKKLRYCLEFFAALYPAKEMKVLIKQLKVLQNNLGDFNDLSVQQEMLQQYLAALRPGTVKSKKLSAAIGGLLTNLYHEHRRVRTRFDDAFARFAEPRNIKLYKKLFS